MIPNFKEFINERSGASSEWEETGDPYAYQNNLDWLKGSAWSVSCERYGRKERAAGKVKSARSDGETAFLNTGKISKFYGKDEQVIKLSMSELKNCQFGSRTIPIVIRDQSNGDEWVGTLTVK